MNLADSKLTNRQWFRMSFMECVTISMWMIPYITITLAGSYHGLALVIGLVFVSVYGCLLSFLTKQVPCGYINAIRNYMGRNAGIVDVVYCVRYLARAALIAVFFSKIVQAYLLPGFSVWMIVIPFLGISIYSAGKTMEGRGRMFELLFGWMLVPIILTVVCSISNADVNAVLQGVRPNTGADGIWKAAYAVLLAVSPLELQLYSQPCVKEVSRGKIGFLLSFVLFAIVFAYFYIVSILGYGWTGSEVTAAFGVMEASSLPGGAIARLDYFVMAFWIIGVFAVVSGYLHQAQDFVYSLCEVKQKKGKCITWLVLAVLLVGLLFLLQAQQTLTYIMRYFLYADFACSIFIPLLVIWVKMKKRVKWGIAGIYLTVAAAIGVTVLGEEQLGKEFLQINFSAKEEPQETLEHRDYVKTIEIVGREDNVYEFCFVIADINGYEGENSIKEKEYAISAESIQEAGRIYQIETERQLDFGHIKKVETYVTGEKLHPFLFEVGRSTGISKSIPVVDEKENKKYILRNMIKAAYGREEL